MPSSTLLSMRLAEGSRHRCSSVQGRKEEAQNAFAEAAASANKLSAHEGIMRTLLPPLSAAELHAAALAGAGQARSAMGDQEGAEALLSQVPSQLLCASSCFPAGR